jgi:hypothetical protein
MGVYERPGILPQPGPLALFLDESRDWAAGRSWLIRLPLVAYLAYALFRHITDGDYSSWFAGLSLGIHELGHVILGFAPFFVTALAGSAAEVLVPIAGMVMFIRQPDYFGISVLGCWLSYNLFGIARYIADSRDQFGVYVSIGGGEAQHDWEYILSSLGLLNHDKAIGGMVKLLASGVGIAFLAWGAWMIWVMWEARKQGRRQKAEGRSKGNGNLMGSS